MYVHNENSPKIDNLPLFLNGTLNADNRWIKLANLVPWHDIEELYAQNFTSKAGPKALPSRVAFAALIIQLKLNLTDRETVAQIAENPYLQYFLGFSEFKLEEPFDASMMTHFRKRFDAENITRINELLHQKMTENKSTAVSDKDGKNDDDPPKNKGKLIIDATCAPADIAHPTDVNLLNDARLKTEEIIDILWKNNPNKSGKEKPRTYRNKGEKAFYSVIKMKRPTKKNIRKAKRRLLENLKRNLTTIDTLSEDVSLSCLPINLYRKLLVINTLYQQQKIMFEKKRNSTSDRIVSISQPHIRPIIRGKARAKTEFGAKISISLVDGYNFVDTVSFDAYNEGTELKAQVEKYHERFGCYPESVHVDRIYRNRENRKFCKQHNIRMSGPQLGRKSSDPEKIHVAEQIARKDEGVRSQVEGSFGIGKRRYSLNLIMTKLPTTSKTLINLIFLVMNLDHLLKVKLWLYSILLDVKFSLRSLRNLLEKSRITSQFKSNKDIQIEKTLIIQQALLNEKYIWPVILLVI